MNFHIFTFKHNCNLRCYKKLYLRTIARYDCKCLQITKNYDYSCLIFQFRPDIRRPLVSSSVTAIRKYHGSILFTGSAAFWKSKRFSLFLSSTAISFLTNCKFIHDVANSNWNEFLNALVCSRSWGKSSCVCSDPG